MTLRRPRRNRIILSVLVLCCVACVFGGWWLGLIPSLGLGGSESHSSSQDTYVDDSGTPFQRILNHDIDNKMEEGAPSREEAKSIGLVFAHSDSGENTSVSLHQSDADPSTFGREAWAKYDPLLVGMPIARDSSNNIMVGGDKKSLRLLQEALVKANLRQEVLNAAAFPPLREGGLVLLVQVHDRELYLRQLVESLREAKGVEDNVLLVFSHDYYSESINSVVRGIDFCRAMQVFYPFSMQLFPNSFPGQSKDDCPRNMDKKEALAIKCLNAEHPDSFGHYREAPVTAIKHHWWWKLNVVFDHLKATSNFTGYVVLLEEDHFLAPDFVAVTRQLIELKEKSCSDCDFINLGLYTDTNLPAVANKAATGYWNSAKNNMAFGMNRATWETVKSCSKEFCEYDDYNWDWSLSAAIHSCLNRHFRVIAVKAPRVYHIGKCGIHHKKPCNEEQESKRIQDKFSKWSSSFFPQSLVLDGGLAQRAPQISKYGGWGDTRDQGLCLKFAGKEGPWPLPIPTST